MRARGRPRLRRLASRISDHHGFRTCAALARRFGVVVRSRGWLGHALIHAWPARGAVLPGSWQYEYLLLCRRAIRQRTNEVEGDQVSVN